MLEFLTISQFVLCFVLVLVFHNLKTELKSERILLWYLIFITFKVIIGLLGSIDVVIVSFPRIILINQPLYFLDAIFLYLFIRSIIRKPLFTWRTYVALIPFGLYSVYMIYAAIGIDWNEDFVARLLEMNASKQKRIGPDGIIYVLSIITFTFIMYIHSFIILRKNGIVNTNGLKVINQLELKWQKQLITWWFLLICLPTALVLFLLLLNIDLGFDYEMITPLGILLLTFVFGMRKIKIRVDELKTINHEVTPTSVVKETPKYGTLKLSRDRIQMINVGINKAVGEDRAFLDPDLTLKSFATNLNEKPYLVSQVVNTVYGKSFQDFINEYRIDFAKKLMQKHPDYKIVHIAFDSGFNAVRTFSTQFKNKTGLTPSEYRSSFLVESD